MALWRKATMKTAKDSEINASERPPFFLEKGIFCDFFIGIKAGGKLWSSIRDARKSIRIVSPFLDEMDLDKLRDKLDGSLEYISIITTAPEHTLEYDPKGPKAVALCSLIHREKLQGRSGFDYFPRRGFNLVVFKETFVHTKLYIIDDEIAYSGSLNFTMKGMTENHESCLTISDREVVKDLIVYFDRLCKYNQPDQWSLADLGKKLGPVFSERESL
jgi:phosphatidylserine/phosphatidylglycerophosphate/cardiolipin synthase-like enzyme